MRLFLAVDVPEGQKRSVEEAVQPLRRVLDTARWTAPDSWHVTIKFLGEVPDERLGEVEKIAGEAARRTPVVQTALTHLGGFPNLRRPRVIWVGLADPGHHLEHLAARMEKKFGKAGFRQESRKLHAHLTLARFKNPPAARGANHESVEKLLSALPSVVLDRSSFSIDELVLFRSHLSPKGSSYEPISRFGFKD